MVVISGVISDVGTFITGSLMLLRCILGIVGSRNIECVQFFYLILFYTDFFIPPDFNEARY